MERRMMEVDRMWVGFLLLFFLFFVVGEGRGKGKWFRMMRARQEVRKCTAGWKEEEGRGDGEKICRPVSDSAPPSLNLPPSLTPPPVSPPPLSHPPVLVSREDEFSGRLSSRAGFRGCSALHYATLADDPHLVRTLLEAGRSLTPPP